MDLIRLNHSQSSRTPASIKNGTSLKYTFNYSSHSSIRTTTDNETRLQKVRDMLDNRVLTLKRSLDVKKQSQLQRIKEIESSRDQKNLDLFEKLQNQNPIPSSLSKGQTRSYEKYSLRTEQIKEYLQKEKRLEEEHIRTSLENFDRRYEKVQEKIKAGLMSKSERAHRMQKNYYTEKSNKEDQMYEFLLKKLLKKIEKGNEKKKRLDQVVQFISEQKRKKEKEKLKEVRKRIRENQKQIEKKKEATEIRLNKGERPEEERGSSKPAGVKGIYEKTKVPKASFN